MHPAEAELWSWDEGNESELAAHGISPWEVEEVFGEGPKWAPNKRNRAGDWKMVGRTSGGRRLTVIVRFYEESALLRPITGWDSTSGERSRYDQG